MKTKINTVALFTDSYPYGEGEAFIGIELEFLSKSFDKIYLIPAFIPKKSIKRETPKNCFIIDILSSTESVDDKILIRRMRFKLLLSELIGFRSKPFWFIRHIGKLNKLASKSIYTAELIISWLNTLERDKPILYTYWYNYVADACSILVHNGVVKKWISRVHGYDLHDERHPLKRQPFREFKTKHCQLVFTDSKRSENYFKARISKKERKKVSTSYLGVDIPENVIDKGRKNPFVIASCSNVIPLKRVNLIFELISKLDIPVKWIHIGDGELMGELKSIVKNAPSNLVINLLGNLPNKEIAPLYLRENVNLFIHLSEIEGGAPVACMDAQSCGIPILGCDVGGIKEMLNSERGILLPVDFDVNHTLKLIYDLIENYHRIEPIKIQDFCSYMFNSSTNFNHFAHLLKHA